jgi:hypothetical protein
MLNTQTDRLAMPVRIDRLELFGPHPPINARLEAVVRIRKLDATAARADIDLALSGSMWARVLGWEDRRFETDESLWRVLREPEKHALASQRPEGYVLLLDRWRTAQARDFLMRRYLGERERAEYAAIGMQRQRNSLAGRVAAKDAVRHWLWARGHGNLFPVEVSIEEAADGHLSVSGPFSEPLTVAIAQSGDLAVATVAVARTAVIDLERVAEGGDRLEAVIRAAKRAAAKARRAATDDAERLPVTVMTGGIVMVDGLRVQTHIDGEHAVAWTVE